MANTEGGGTPEERRITTNDLQSEVLKQQLEILKQMKGMLDEAHGIPSAKAPGTLTTADGGVHDFDKKNSIIGRKFIDYEKDMAPRPVAKPPNVELDCKVLGIYEIKCEEQTFKIKFEVTCKWIDPSIPASEGGVYPEFQQPNFSEHFRPKIDVLDVLAKDQILEMDPPQLEDRYSGKVSMKGTFLGDIIQVYNMRDFPFDVQYLSINFKMAEVKEWLPGGKETSQGSWRIKAETQGEFQHPKMKDWLIKRGNDDELLILRPHFPDPRMDKLTEWDILRVQGKPVATNTDSLASTKVYDGFQVTIIVSREWINAVLNLALLLFFNVLLSFTAYAVPPEDFSDRMEITLTLFLSAMAFKFTANQKLPPVNYLTLMDQYILLGFNLMAVQSIGYWVLSRAEGEAAEEFVYFSGDLSEGADSGTITGLLVRGSIDAAGKVASSVDGATAWVLDFPWDDDAIQRFDSIMFLIMVFTWIGFTMVFVYKAIKFERSNRLTMQSADNALWYEFQDREELDEFEENEINAAGLDHYKDLDKTVQGEWLKFLRYDRAPKVLLIDCRTENGTFYWFTFDGIVKCEEQFDKIWKKLPRKTFYNWLRGKEGLATTITSMQNSHSLGIWAHEAKAKLGSEATSKEDERKLLKFIKQLEPDMVVATMPVNPSEIRNVKLDNRETEVNRFFSKMHINVDMVDAFTKGRMEAFAVEYASIRHLLPMPGIIINVRGRHVRITSTKNKKTYVVRRGWKDLVESIQQSHERVMQSKSSKWSTDGKNKVDEILKEWNGFVSDIAATSGEIKQQALGGILGIDGGSDCWDMAFNKDRNAKPDATTLTVAEVYQIFKDKAGRRKDDIFKAKKSTPIENKQVYTEFSMFWVMETILETLKLHKEKRRIIDFKKDWHFYGPATIFQSNWQSGWYLNQLLSKEVEHNQPTILLFDSQDGRTDIYNMSLLPGVGQVVVTKVTTSLLMFGIDDLQSTPWTCRVHTRDFRDSEVESRREKLKDEIRQYLGTGVDVVVMAETSPNKFFKHVEESGKTADDGVGVGIEGIEVELNSAVDHGAGIEMTATDLGAVSRLQSSKANKGDSYNSSKPLLRVLETREGSTMKLTDLNDEENGKWLQQNKEKVNLYRIHFGGTDLKDDSAQARKSPKQFAQYEALGVRYACQQFGLPLPSAVVTAKGDYVLLVRFPERSDVEMKDWEVIEMKLPLLRIEELIEAKIYPEEGKEEETNTLKKVLDFNKKEKNFKRQERIRKTYDDVTNFARELANDVEEMIETACGEKSSLCDGLVVAAGEFSDKYDKSEDLLGKVQGQHVPIYSASEAYEEVSVFEAGVSLAKDGASHRSPSRRVSGGKKTELNKYIKAELANIRDEAEMVKVLMRVFKYHARSLVLKDIFATRDDDANVKKSLISTTQSTLTAPTPTLTGVIPGAVSHERSKTIGESSSAVIKKSVGFNPIVSLSLPPVESSGHLRSKTMGQDPQKNREASYNLVPHQKIIFSKLWRFENQFEAFPTNWVAGWYIQSMKNTGSLYDSETCLMFDFGSGEGKSILCTFCDGRISTTELCKYERLEDFILEKNGKTRDEMKREIINQAQEVSASLIVIGTTSWHREPQNLRETDRFLESVEDEFKKTKIRLVINYPEGRLKERETAHKANTENCKVEADGSNPSKSDNPLTTHLTPMKGESEARYESTATIYAAESNGFDNLAVTYGSGGGSTQISLVDPTKRKVKAMIAEELGSRKGVKLIEAHLKAEEEKRLKDLRTSRIDSLSGNDLATLIKDVEQENVVDIEEEDHQMVQWLGEGVKLWREEIQKKLSKWTIKEYDGENPRHVKELTQEFSKDRLVVGISAVFYGFSGSKRHVVAKVLEQIPHPEVLESLQHKLDLCLHARADAAGGGFTTDPVTEFDKPIKFKKKMEWITEIANVTYQHEVISTLYHKTSKFYFSREWQVGGAPFRTTWSTGWFIEYLRYRQVLRFGRIALVIRMTSDEGPTSCFIRREAEKDEVEVPINILEESKHTHGEFKQLSEYFHQGDESLLISKIQGIQREIRADAVVVELGEEYLSKENDMKSNYAKHPIFERLNCAITEIPWGEDFQDKGNTDNGAVNENPDTK